MNVAREMIKDVEGWAYGAAAYDMDEDVIRALCSLASAVLDGREALERGAKLMTRVGEPHIAHLLNEAAALRRILDHLEDEP